MAEPIIQQYVLVSRLIETFARMESGRANLNLVASDARVSVGQMHELLKQWAGVSTEKFLRCISEPYIKSRVTDQAVTLFDGQPGMSSIGQSQMNRLPVTLERISDLDFGRGGAGLRIRYSFAVSPFGRIMVASTSRGVCHLTYFEDRAQALRDLKDRFPMAEFILEPDLWQSRALSVFQHVGASIEEIRLHVRGTDFQIKVWNALLNVSTGDLSTYGKIALELGKPDASRAVGAAVGSNPVAYIIPCHRVVQASGKIGGYMWGVTRKIAMIGWEAARKIV